MTVSTNPTETPPTESTQNSDFADLQARIATLEAQLSARMDSEKQKDSQIEELRRRKSLLRHKDGEPDEELRTHLAADIEAKQRALDEAERAVRARPHDNYLTLQYQRVKKALKLAREQMSAQFPTVEPIPVSLTPAQEREREQVESEYAAAATQFKRNINDITALSRLERARKARRQFWAKCGMRMPNA